MSGTQPLDTMVITLQNRDTGDLLPVYIDVFNDALSTKWYGALNDILAKELHLEKNYQFFGIPQYERNGDYITDQINDSIHAINDANLGYHIHDCFSMANTIQDIDGEIGDNLPGRKLIHQRMNDLHRYFEDLQGTSGNMSPFYNKADKYTRWHIRQLNLLCHEYESWVLSYRKQEYAKEWMRPSQLMCFLNAPRFELTAEDYESFGIETIARPLGGVFVGVNKAVGKHHWEVFQDEGGRSIDELTTSTLRSQTEAAGDFDIEWANNPGEYEFMKKELADFKQWLINNNFDPADKSLTIGHPQVAQVNLNRSFGTDDYAIIWKQLFNHLDVFSIETEDNRVEFEYNWDDLDYREQQVEALSK